MKDPESITWQDWGAIFHRAVKDFVHDAEGAEPAPDSPMGKFVASLRAASEAYERALAEKLATQDTEKVELPVDNDRYEWERHHG